MFVGSKKQTRLTQIKQSMFFFYVHYHSRQNSQQLPWRCLSVFVCVCVCGLVVFVFIYFLCFDFFMSCMCVGVLVFFLFFSCIWIKIWRVKWAQQAPIGSKIVIADSHPCYSTAQSIWNKMNWLIIFSGHFATFAMEMLKRN